LRPASILVRRFNLQRYQSPESFFPRRVREMFVERHDLQ
jgi:hypothetical protein